MLEPSLDVHLMMARECDLCRPNLCWPSLYLMSCSKWHPSPFARFATRRGTRAACFRAQDFAQVVGRLAVSVLAMRRDKVAHAALREAARMHLGAGGRATHFRFRVSRNFVTTNVASGLQSK